MIAKLFCQGWHHVAQEDPSSQIPKTEGEGFAFRVAAVRGFSAEPKPEETDYSGVSRMVLQQHQALMDPSSGLNKVVKQAKITEWALAQAELIKRLEAENEKRRQDIRKPVPPVSYAVAVGNLSNTGINSKTKQLVAQTRRSLTLLVSGKATESVKEKLRQHKALNDKLKVEPAKKRNPLLILYDVPSDMKEDNIKEAVYEQNFAEQISKQEFNKNFCFRFNTGPKGRPTCHVVVKVSSRARELARKGGKYTRASG
ncbi:hypothetical protein Trydic_g22836 [Trypoxylus dichotomus]